MARAFAQPPHAVVFVMIMLGMYVGHLRGSSPFQRQRWDYEASLVEQQQQQQQAEALNSPVVSNGGPGDPGRERRDVVNANHGETLADLEEKFLRQRPQDGVRAQVRQAPVETPPLPAEVVEDGDEAAPTRFEAGRFAITRCSEDGPASDASNIEDYQSLWHRLIARIRCGRVFTFVSYDHEALLIAGHVYSITHHTGQYFGPPLAPSRPIYRKLRGDILNSIEDFVNTPDYYFGVPIPPCKEGLTEEVSEGGGQMSNMVTLLGRLRGLETKHLGYSSLFTHMSHDRSEAFFETVLRDYDKAYFVSFLGSLKIGTEMEWKKRLITLPPDAMSRWDLKRQQVLDRLLTFVSNLGRSGAEGSDKPIVLVSAGALTGVLISQMHTTNVNVTYIDVDGLFDRSHAVLGKKGRHQLSGGESGGGDGMASCTFSRYERKGDCVQGVEDKAMSPLCFPKGSKGKAEAGRLGGFFPRDHERREEELRAKKRAKILRKKDAKIAQKKAIGATLRNAEKLHAEHEREGNQGGDSAEREGDGRP